MGIEMKYIEFEIYRIHHDELKYYIYFRFFPI